MSHSEDATIAVMRYRYWNPESQSLVESEAYATHEAILNGLGMPINESSRRVNRADIDHNGVLKRTAREAADRD